GTVARHPARSEVNARSEAGLVDGLLTHRRMTRCEEHSTRATSRSAMANRDGGVHRRPTFGFRQAPDGAAPNPSTRRFQGAHINADRGPLPRKCAVRNRHGIASYAGRRPSVEPGRRFPGCWYSAVSGGTGAARRPFHGTRIRVELGDETLRDSADG